MSIKMRYITNKEKLPVKEVSIAMDRIWADLQRDDSRASRMAKKAGVDLKDVRNRKRSDVISVEYGGAGLDPVTIGILINVSYQVIKLLVEKVIVPMIQEDKGSDVIKPEDPNTAEPKIENPVETPE